VKSNQLARILRKKGVESNDIIGIMVERSFEMLIGILGILKAGGAYLPIDHEYPKGRIGFMLEDSEASILLTQSWLKGKIVFGGEVIELDDPMVYEGNDIINLESVNQSKDMAYVIYTSGSTGTPKGVMVEHSSVVNLLYDLEANYPLEKGDAYLLKTAYTFDASVPELFGWFISGEKLVILPCGYESLPKEIINTIAEKKITHIYFVPSTLNLFLDEVKNLLKGKLQTLKYVFTIGEILKQETVQAFYRYVDSAKLENVYGPVEATVYNSRYTAIFEENNISVPIGKPAQNANLHVIGKNRNLQPIGIAGELCISGVCLARGYLNRPELTAEKFVENPFVPGERMYRTGDLARWLPDGNIEFLGRIDHQVKIRGFRIELGEIESRLLELEVVKEAVVLAWEDKSGDMYLCAYIVSDVKLSVSDLWVRLSDSLPGYMIPSYFVQLDELPLNKSGKVDRKVIPAPDGGMGITAEYEAPRNRVEEILARIWSEVLGVEKIGIHDNFFERGGNSLKGTVLASRIHKEMNVELPLKELFKSPTISGIAKYLSKVKPSTYVSIEAAEKKEYYEVSSAQKRMYVLQQLDQEAVNYNIPDVLMVEGVLDKEKLGEAAQKLIERHEVLRTTFETIDDRVVQRLHKNVEFSVDYLQKIVEYAENPDKCMEEAIKDFIRPFDLGKAPLLRVALIKLTEEKQLLLFDTHHVISDGISMLILTREFTEIYSGNELKPQRLQYKDFSEWQNAYLKSEGIQEQEKYWLDRFSDEIPVLNIPLDYTRPVVQDFKGSSIELRIDHELAKKINKLTKEMGTTLYMVLLSAVNILLSKYSGQEDIIIGSPIAGRPHADLDNILGMFVNTLVMRNYPESGKTYAEFLGEVKENALRAYENQEYQFEELVEKLNLRRDMSRNPLFDVMFALRNMDKIVLELGDLKFSGYEPSEKAAKFDLSFIATEAGEDILIEIEYRTGLLKRETVERLSGHLCNLIKAITEDISVLLGEIDILSEEERNKVLSEFNDTCATYPREKTIHQLFEEQAERMPDNVAVIFNDENMTYRELNMKSNQLALVLRKKGVNPDCIVGIMVERSFEMIIGILGILKAGGAYMPIDPEYPEERIRFMIEDSETNILLTQSKLRDLVRVKGDIFELDDSRLYEGDTSDPKFIGCANDLAYVIYTSGSTGKPKGVMVEHKAIVNRLLWMQKEYPLSVEDVILQKTTYTFDVSLWELLWWSFTGAKVCLLGPGEEKDILAIIRAIERNQVSVMHFVPSMFTIFLDHISQYQETSRIKTLKRIFASGEALGLKQVLDFNHNIRKVNGTELINLYGPTEAAVDVTYFNTSIGDFEKEIPIGKPIDNTSLYIIEKHDILSPIGVPGELCISGVCLARGYLNRPELTAEKFVENPFIPGERMYRSGDLARWLPDGNIEFLDRIDKQVKIRGFRIELGEIESRLLDIEEVKEAVVLAREDEVGDKYLCAYIVGEEELSINELKSILRKKLPTHMIPSYFVQLTELPLTLNGKVDRRSLPAPEGNITREVGYVEPRNQLEMSLVAIWENVLGVKPIGIYDNFFETGGHSLKLTIVASRINSELQVTVPLAELYANPYIAHIAEYIIKTGDEELKNVDNIILLKKGKQADRNIFFVHAFAGRPEVYTKLVGNMGDDFNYWGIRYEKIDSYDPSLPTVENLAASHIEEIKKIQEKGPYYISGWCVGGVVAFEMVRQLEKINDEVKFLGLYNSSAPTRRLGLFNAFVIRNTGFTIQTELSIMRKILPDHAFLENYKGITSIEVLWRHLAEDLEKVVDYNEVKEKIYEKICSISPIIKAATQKQKEVTIKHILLYFNLSRGYGNIIGRLYKPQGKINTPINYFAATKDERPNIDSWSKYSNKKVNFARVDADHFSMFEDDEDAKKLSAALMDVLDKIS
jgi:amino acid adenylation domain-containing protein